MSAEQLLKDNPMYYPLPKPRPYVFQKPDLVNLNPALGKRVFPKVFAIPMRAVDISAFLMRHFPNEDHIGVEGYTAFRTLGRNVLPPEVDRVADLVLPTDDGKYLEITGLVIGSNLGESDLERTEDKALIEKVREVLCVETQPGWHYFYTDY